MSDLRKAAQQALEALDKQDAISGYPNYKKQRKALREALAQPEPVMFNGLTEAETNATASVMGLTRPEPEPVWVQGKPTRYVARPPIPPQRQPLTDQEAKVLWADVYAPEPHIWVIAERFVRAVEAAHGIGGGK